MRDADALGTGGVDGFQQTGPIGVVGEDEACFDVGTAFGATDGHPAGGAGGGAGAELGQPGGTVGAGRGDDHTALGEALELFFVFSVDQFIFGKADACFFVVGQQGMHRAVDAYGADVVLQAGKDALGFAKRVGKDDAALLMFPVELPPAVDVVHHHLAGLPTVDGQAKGRFADEDVAADRFNTTAGGIVLRLIVARKDPDEPLVFDPHHAGSQDMAGGMQAHFDAMHVDRFTVLNALHLDVSTESMLEQADAIVGNEVVRCTAPGMVAVGVGDDGAIDRTPGVDVEIADGAVEATLGHFEEMHAQEPETRSQ